MARKLTDRQRKKIIADYVECQNYSAVAKKNDVSWTTVKNIVCADDSSVKKLEQKKEQNTLDMLDYLATRKDKAQNLVDLCLDYMSKPEKLQAAQISQLSTAMGTVIDKFAPISSLNDKSKERYYLDTLLISDNFNTARRDILDHGHTEYVFEGGRGSTKSSFIANIIIELMKNNPDCHVLALRQVSNTLKDSVYAKLKWAINEQGLDSEFEYKQSRLEIVKKDTKQKIYFRGADDPMKIKSIAPEFGYIGIAWFEELDAFNGEESVRNIEQSAIRGGDTAWIFKSFNPPKTKDNWANKFILVPKERRLIHHSVYTDVPPKWLGKTFLDEAEFLKEVNPTAYEHEYMGIPNGNGGNVFENVTLREITDDELRTFDRIYYGLDFGFYPDPLHFGEMYFNANQRRLYIYREIRKYKTRNEDLAVLLDDWRKVKITADSAENKSIADFQSWGFNMYGAVKGPGSVEYSVKWLQSLVEIIIDPVRCPATAEEFLGYEYLRDKEGNIVSGYPDANNHAIDMTRYALEEVWRRRGQ